ncbi:MULTISPECIES: hypothetical protein [unclassified Streptomyces]|uniref:hypothetical protein n=1 Tax=unclassified Streptomyces TaxID=2593676 RepID=UPI00339AC992
MTPHELIRLESGCRSRRYSLGALGRDALLAGAPTPDDATDDATEDRYGTAVAALMSFDRSGYLREAGVARLAGTDDPFAVPFLLLRLNDPVEQVRVPSQDAVAARLAPEHVGLLVELPPSSTGCADAAGPAGYRRRWRSCSTTAAWRRCGTVPGRTTP